MNTIRIISRLDIKGPNLVKGVHLEGLRVLGDPKVFAEAYYKDGADELIYMDVVASLYGRNSLLDFVNYTADIIFIPLTVGGGVRTIEDVKKLLRAGADKVSINTAVIKNPEFIKKASETFGAQCIVVSIEAKLMPNGTYECFTDNGRERTGINAIEWSKKVEDLGAGEILLTSVDKEGTGMGYDIALTKAIATSVSIPVIACGGCGKADHIKEAMVEGTVEAVAAASVFHYDKLKTLITSSVSKDYQEGNINYLKDFSLGAVNGRKNITPTSIVEAKRYLDNCKIPCRLL